MLYVICRALEAVRFIYPDEATVGGFYNKESLRPFQHSRSISINRLLPEPNNRKISIYLIKRTLIKLH